MKPNAPARPLRVLHVVAPGPIGGLERVAHALAAGQRQCGHEVRVAVVTGLQPDSQAFPDALKASGINTLSLRLPPRAYLREYTGVRRLCSELRPDIVHTHGYRPDVVAGAAARRSGVATVSTVHGFTGGDPKNRVYERLQVRAFRGFDAVVAVSAPLAQQIASAGIREDRVHCVLNAWSGSEPALSRSAARDALGIEPHAPHIGWVGRLSAEKGADVLMDALASMDGLDPVVSIIGAGRDADCLQRRVKALGIDGMIRFHGTVPDAHRFFSAFDVFVLSSRTEGTPMVLFEAMAAGTPIIATRVGGVPDVLSGAEALLIPPDDPAALGAAISEVFCDPESAAARARAAHECLRTRFGSASWLAAYDRVYQRVLEVRKGKR